MLTNTPHTTPLFSPTIFAVEVDLHSPLLRPEEGLRHLGDGQTLGVGPVQEVARARLLHDLGTRVAAHVAEAIVAEDDGAVLDPRVGDDELATWGGREKVSLRRHRQHQIRGTRPWMNCLYY